MLFKLQFSEFEREPTAEETETVKWEGYPALVGKMRWRCVERYQRG